jgi:hypothetical protein
VRARTILASVPRPGYQPLEPRSDRPPFVAVNERRGDAARWGEQVLRGDVPGFAIVPMVIGGIVQDVWKRVSPRTEDVYNTPLASGFITGEALILLVLALFSARELFG